jgi:MFS transporter, DHA2 family, multidrug resistance protein
VIIWVGALQIMLDTGKENDWFDSTSIVVLSLVALVGFAVFLIWEWTDHHPIVDIRLFRDRNYTLGVISLSGGFALFSGNIVLLPLWLQQSMGYSATWAGLVLAPVGVVAILCTPLAGRAIDRGYARTIAVIAFLSFALSFWLRSKFNIQADFATIVLPLFFQGVGGSLFFISTVAISFSNLPTARLPFASGLSNFVRISAGAFGTSIGTTLWDVRSRHHRVHLVEDVSREGWTLDHPLFDPLRAAGMDQEQIRAQIERLIEQQAATLAINDVFLITTFIYLLLIIPVVLARPVAVRRGSAPEVSVNQV